MDGDEVVIPLHSLLEKVGEGRFYHLTLPSIFINSFKRSGS